MSPLVLVSDLVLGESPRWHGGRLWLADWGAHELLAVDPAGDREVIAQVPSFPFSFDWLSSGELLIIAGSDHRLVRLGADGSLVVHTDLRPLMDRPWNEIVIDQRDDVYVNSIGFDMMAGEAVRPGIVAVVHPDGSSRLVAEDLMFPNGMAITADGSTLIVAESYGKCLTAFDIGDNGDLSNRRVWADLGDGAPDGICIDAEGAIWYADVPNRRCVRVREGGAVMQTVEIDRGCFACMLGGDDGSTLFIVAAEWRGPAAAGEQARTGRLLSVDVSSPHAGRP